MDGIPMRTSRRDIPIYMNRGFEIIYMGRIDDEPNLSAADVKISGGLEWIVILVCSLRFGGFSG
jgi:hypothetical protein